MGFLQHTVGVDVVHGVGGVDDVESVGFEREIHGVFDLGFNADVVFLGELLCLFEHTGRDVGGGAVGALGGKVDGVFAGAAAEFEDFFTGKVAEMVEKKAIFGASDAGEVTVDVDSVDINGFGPVVVEGGFFLDERWFHGGGVIGEREIL